MTGNVPGEGLLWLDGDDENDASIWLDFWSRSRARRPHDHPVFLRVMGEGTTPAAVIYRHPSGATVFHPFSVRSLAELPFHRETPSAMIHLVSPYGYGGPLYEGPPERREEISALFEALFEAEAARRGVVSEFVREDLFPDRLALRARGERMEQQPNVAVRLDRDPEAIWRGYDAKVRKNVNRARSHGLRVVFDESGELLDRFLSVYTGTMERTGAARSFFISRERFERLTKALAPEGALAYAHVFDGEEVISTELLLLSADAVYSFLGGTSAASFDKRPNDLLKHEVIMWGRSRDLRHYVLGGGISPGDGMFAYKKAFDPEGILPFFVRRVVHDPAAYALLTQARSDHEARQGREWRPRSDFFPSYLS